MSDLPPYDSDDKHRSESVPQEFREADSVSEVYSQVFAINFALEVVTTDPNQELSRGDEYEAAAFDFLNTDIESLATRIKSAVDAIESNLREVVTEDYVDTYTISLSGGLPTAIKLDVTFKPSSDTDD